MTNDEARGLKVGHVVQYHEQTFQVEHVAREDPTPLVRLLGLPFTIHPRDLEPASKKAPPAQTSPPKRKRLSKWLGLA